MKTKNSIFRCIGLDIKRGLSNRRFWAVLGVFSVIFVVHMMLDAVWPLSQYYNGGEKALTEEYGGRLFTLLQEISRLNDMILFSNYFPFLGSVAYAYTVIDDRRNRYCMQLIQKSGFSNYYWGRMISSGILGGLLGALCMGAICLLAAVFTTWNPFISDAAEFLREWEMEIERMNGNTEWLMYFGWGYDQAYAYLENHYAIWYCLGACKYFVMGMLFGLLAGIIAFFSDNKIFLYAGPVLAIILWDKWSYTILDFLGADNRIIQGVSLRANNASYSDLYQYSLLAFFIVLLLIFARHFKGRTRRFYMEGGTEDD